MKRSSKFFSGVTAWEAVVYVSMGLSGMLPTTLFGFTLTQAPVDLILDRCDRIRIKANLG